MESIALTYNSKQEAKTTEKKFTWTNNFFLYSVLFFN